MKKVMFTVFLCMALSIAEGANWVQVSKNPDGVTWTSRNSGSTANLNGVTYGNDTFVAVGNGGTMLTSPDGVTWTSRNSGSTANLNETTYGNDTFVAVGNGGTIIQSAPME